MDWLSHGYEPILKRKDEHQDRSSYVIYDDWEDLDRHKGLDIHRKVKEHYEYGQPVSSDSYGNAIIIPHTLAKYRGDMEGLLYTPLSQ